MAMVVISSRSFLGVNIEFNLYLVQNLSYINHKEEGFNTVGFISPCSLSLNAFADSIAANAGRSRRL